MPEPALDRARRAAALWQLDPASVVLVAERENLTFRALDRSGAQKALRLHRPGYSSQAEILSELEWLRALSAAGVAVPQPLASRGGQLVETLGDRAVSVLDWVPGKPLRQIQDEVPPQDCRAIYAALGRALARLHDVSDSWTPPPAFTRRRWDEDGLLGEAPVWGRFWENPQLSPDQRRHYDDVRQRARAALDAAKDQLDFGLIHADALHENVLVDGGAICLIDFDDAGYGWRLFELATTLQRTRDRPDYAALRDALIAGYREVRPLDTAHLPLFRVLRALTYLGWIVPRLDEPGGRERSARMLRAAQEVTGAWLAGTLEP